MPAVQQFLFAVSQLCTEGCLLRSWFFGHLKSAEARCNRKGCLTERAVWIAVLRTSPPAPINPIRKSFSCREKHLTTRCAAGLPKVGTKTVKLALWTPLAVECRAGADTLICYHRNVTRTIKQRGRAALSYDSLTNRYPQRGTNVSESRHPREYAATNEETTCSQSMHN